jgi:hypothetical protein
MEHENKRELWEGNIREWSESGLSQREYCLRQSLTYSAFRYWYRRLVSGDAQPETNGRVRAFEVSQKAMKPQTATMNPMANGEVETDKIVIEIPGTKVTVTISGRMSLERLIRIMSVFNEIGGHAEA